MLDSGGSDDGGGGGVLDSGGRDDDGDGLLDSGGRDDDGDGLLDSGVVDAQLSDERSGVRVLLSAGRRLVLEKGYLHTLLRLTHALNEYPTRGSERSCQNARVMRLTCCSSVGSEGTYVGNGLLGNPCKALRAH
ncbi:hypothetical protein ElyMa_005502200 [Elysia marginata]|uniref:Uncharacterized protein n=1 Tax=Elysia marginata TaxID=1093978 RepID=A0AAV4EU18_9GAST|nr:hypothetical protein ElyMa_005502200 [Elysia marginata]